METYWGVTDKNHKHGKYMGILATAYGAGASLMPGACLVAVVPARGLGEAEGRGRAAASWVEDPPGLPEAENDTKVLFEITRQKLLRHR